MTRRIERELRCRCGTRVEATPYESVNVRLDPDLKGELLDGRLNLVTCLECGREQHVDIALLYHDPERRIAIWVYPKERKGQATEIKKEMERQGALIQTLTSRSFSEHGASPGVVEMLTEFFGYLANPHVVFGLDELAQLLAELEGENH